MSHALRCAFQGTKVGLEPVRDCLSLAAGSSMNRASKVPEEASPNGTGPAEAAAGALEVHEPGDLSGQLGALRGVGDAQERASLEGPHSASPQTSTTLSAIPMRHRETAICAR
ncbi:hypothetical protein Ais01nite_21860 [Asanoa ishikariensis]|nr:hypothetical protein Ais01nite_21860 [Asanoa ishikariensis]